MGAECDPLIHTKLHEAPVLRSTSFFKEGKWKKGLAGCAVKPSPNPLARLRGQSYFRHQSMQGKVVSDHTLDLHRLPVEDCRREASLKSCLSRGAK